MKVLLVHARYAQPGGEERMVDTVDAVLTARGHDVVRHEEAVVTVVSRGARRRVEDVLRAERPDVMHVHNFFPTIGPSVYATAAAARVPIVQHLHNARVVCLQPFLLRDGGYCTDCVGHSPLPGVLHRCYRGSALASAAAATSLMAHRGRGTWSRRVQRFAAVSEAVAGVVRAGGVVPAARLVVCANGLAIDPGARSGSGDDVVFVGRVNYEKGVDVFVDAAALVPEMHFVVVGDGPERATLARRAGANVSFVGARDAAGVNDALRAARVLVAPSRGQEPFGLGVIEAAALGVPAIVARAGGLPELVQDGHSGVVVEPSNAAAIADALRALTPAAAAAMGAAARRVFVQHYAPDAFAARLLALYDEAIGAYAP